MKNQIFNNISKLIERDNKATTYKFAVLRGVIDIIQENSPYIYFTDDKVHFPTGLMIEKWLLYYYPIFESKSIIPQINGDSNLAFEIQFKKVVEFYKEKGGFSAFYTDIKTKGIPILLKTEFLSLSKKLYSTITKMPMKYIGNSINNEYYSIFNFDSSKPNKNISQLNLEFLILNFGTFSIPKEYYDVFSLIGSFISGQDSIIFKWADFSVKASKKSLSVEKVMNEMLKSPITDRDIIEAKSQYKELLRNEKSIFCVWSGERITSLNQLHIDHMIPFSVWKNNDLWNLLPAKPKINNKKRDRIPTEEIIEKRKDLIIEYWEIFNKHQSSRFRQEINIALLGDGFIKDWQTQGINQLKKCCNYLILNRGFEEWNL